LAIGLLLSSAAGCCLTFPADDDPAAEAELSPRDRERRAAYQRQLELADEDVDRRWEEDGERHQEVEQRLRSPREARVRRADD
jgi:hypothetical protein